jgi:3-oxoacyl-[acyl-carrier protein] reductase
VQEVDVELDFRHKVVLLTGGSRGIGRAIARMFAEAAAHVALNFRSDQERAAATVAELQKISSRNGIGGRHFHVQADITSPAAVKRMVDEVVARMGRVDVLVNNAGIFIAHPLTDVSYEDWQETWLRVIQTNLIGAANVSYCVAKQMILQGGGRIVNVSSRGAFRGEPTAPAYGASKAGMNALGQSLAKALAPHGVFVHTVAPGFVETEMAAPRLAGPDGDAIRAQSPLGRVAKPEEVARVVLFLAAEGNEFTTGCIVDVNGASYLRT